MKIIAYILLTALASGVIYYFIVDEFRDAFLGGYNDADILTLTMFLAFFWPITLPSAAAIFAVRKFLKRREDHT